MYISNQNKRIQNTPRAGKPKTPELTPEEQYEKSWESYNSDRNDSNKWSPFRIGASVVAGAAALGAAGHYLGGLTGVGGAVAGAAVGAAGGITVGALAGSVVAEAKDAGSGALAYLGMGFVGGAATGLVAGGYFGLQSIPVAGAIAGGLGGVALGYMGGQMWEDSIDNNLRAKHGLN